MTRRWRAQHAALVRGLEEMGWKEGQNVQLETRWVTADPERIRRYVADLIALDLDVIVAPGNAVALSNGQPARCPSCSDLASLTCRHQVSSLHAPS
jgi:hypothetical protein